MKLKLISLSLIVFFSMFSSLDASSRLVVPKPGSYTVYLFLGDECIISQQYTLLLNRLYEEYNSEDVSFIGLFPNPSSTENKILVFKEKYGLAFNVRQDALQKEMDRFGVKVTPEVVVFQNGENKIIYKGRIDNTFYRVGKRRAITTTSELEDVLKMIKLKSIILPKNTEAIGCLITPLDANLKNLPMCKPSAEQR